MADLFINEGGDGGCNRLQNGYCPISHCNWAPKWLSPLIFTNLGIWALKLGDGQKNEPTKSMLNIWNVLAICFWKIGCLF